MATRRPNYCSDHFYHFYNRGAHRLALFREPDNYLFVLRKMKHYVAELDLTVIAYCLLPNHYHLLAHQDGDHSAGLLPQRVFNSYTKAYNRRYDHSGTILEGPYRVKALTDESHLLHLCRYIHANPVRHGLVGAVDDWPYSNYLEWTGKRGGTLVDRDFMGEHFPSPVAYADFVSDYLLESKLPRPLRTYLEAWER